MTNVICYIVAWAVWKTVGSSLNSTYFKSIWLPLPTDLRCGWLNMLYLNQFPSWCYLFQGWLLHLQKGNEQRVWEEEVEGSWIWTWPEWFSIFPTDECVCIKSLKASLVARSVQRCATSPEILFAQKWRSYSTLTMKCGAFFQKSQHTAIIIREGVI